MAAFRSSIIEVAAASLPRSNALWATGFLIAIAWLAAVVLQVSGNSSALHHHALIEGEAGQAPPPLWLAIPVFLLAWQLMIAAMMLPASLRAVGVVAASRLVNKPGVAIVGFLTAYSLIWSGFGVAAFLGDVGLHHLVDTTPWLAARPWLIQAASLAVAGAYQLVPVRRRALEACRHPISGGPAQTSEARIGFGIGLAHAVDCLVCSWALMLLMFAAGLANLAWMAILAVVMAYEAGGRHGSTFGILVGAVLLAVAAAAATGVALGF